MAFDASVFAQANKPSVAIQDPNEVLARAAGAANAVNQNRLFQATQMAGQAFQGAIDPTTGRLDQNKLGVALSQLPPEASIAIQPALQQAAAQQGENLGNDQTAQAIKTRQNDFLSRNFGAVLDLPNAQLHDGAVAATQRAIQAGVVDQATGMGMLARLPDDPGALRTQLRQVQLSLQPPDQQQAQIFGAPSTVDNGQAVIPGVTASAAHGGGFAPGPGAVQTYPSRAAQLTQVNGVDGQNRPTQQTLGDRALQQGRGDLLGPAGAPPGLPPALRNPNAPQLPFRAGGGYAPPGAPAAPASQSPTAPASGGALTSWVDSNGVQQRGSASQYNAAKAAGQVRGFPAAGAPSAGDAPVTASTAGNAVVTGLSPAEQAAATTTGTISATKFQDIADQGQQAHGQNAVLGNMLADTTQFTTGQTGVNNFKATIQRQAPAIASAFGVDPAKVAANESFDKLANQIAGAQGAGSDARLAVAQGANPSSHLSASGVDQILRQLQGNADYLQARAKIAAAYPNQADRAGFDAGVGAQLDPRAFQFDRMTPQQRTAYVSSLSPQDRDRVRAAYNFAHGQGLLGISRGQ